MRNHSECLKYVEDGLKNKWDILIIWLKLNLTNDLQSSVGKLGNMQIAVPALWNSWWEAMANKDSAWGLEPDPGLGPLHPYASIIYWRRSA